MRTWERKGYEVVEVEFDGDLHEFEVVKNGEVIATITPDTIEDMEQIIKDLDSGEGVDGWEDGMGNTISIDEDEEMNIFVYFSDSVGAHGDIDEYNELRYELQEVEDAENTENLRYAHYYVEEEDKNFDMTVYRYLKTTNA